MLTNIWKTVVYQIQLIWCSKQVLFMNNSEFIYIILKNIFTHSKKYNNCTHSHVFKVQGKFDMMWYNDITHDIFKVVKFKQKHFLEDGVNIFENHMKLTWIIMDTYLPLTLNATSDIYYMNLQGVLKLLFLLSRHLCVYYFKDSCIICFNMI